MARKTAHLVAIGFLLLWGIENFGAIIDAHPGIHEMPPVLDEDCANPLLLGWIAEWLDQARERNSKGVTVYAVIHECILSKLTLC